MTITSELLIHASVQRVWELTVGVEAWPQLSPTTMTSIERLDEGPLRVGSTARVVQPRQRPTVWTVVAFEAERLFSWQAKVLTVTMTATHRLIAQADGCRNVLTVELTGAGHRLLERLAGNKIREAIATENECFKSAAERTEA